MTHLSVRLLGPLLVTLDGQAITGFETEKVRALLAYLAVEADRPHRRDFLAELLWPDRPTGAANANLRHTLARLRHSLGEAAAQVDADPQAAPPFLHVTRQTIQFDSASNAWVDTKTFIALLRGAQSADLPPFPMLEEAVVLYRGLFWEDAAVTDSAAFEEWLLLTRGHFGRLMLDALHSLATGYEKAGDHAHALVHARHAVETDPCDEPAQRQVMRLLALTGQRSAALAQYEACRTVLAAELGVEPATETTALSQRIRSGELESPAQHRERQPSPPLPAFLVEGAKEAEPSIFVAREQELARLHSFLAQALDGHGSVAFVTGGPGQGKTALLGEFARREMNAHPNLLLARGACSAIAGVGDPYLPFRDVMAMLTGEVESHWLAGTISRDYARRLWSALPTMIPALLANGSALIDTLLAGDPLLARTECALPDRADWLESLRALITRARSGQAGLEQSFLFEQYAAVLRALAHQQPLLLLLDDMQWVDNASIGLLFHLGRQMVGHCRILIVCAYRPEEVALDRAGEQHPLAQVLHEFKRTFGDVWVDLDAAAQREGRNFVDAFLNTERNRLGDDFRTALFRRTAGHPLFTVELLRAMQARGDLLRDVRSDGAWIANPDLNWDELPARVEAVIQARVDRLDGELREIVDIASVEGEFFTAQVVAAVKNIAEEALLRALQKLERLHRLVRDRGEVQAGTQRVVRYQFNHSLVQEYIYRHLTVRERRLLHGQIATALERQYQGCLAEVAMQLAYHFRAANELDQESCYTLLAAENAARAHAHHEAVALYARAIALTHDHPRDAATLVDLYRARGLAYQALGDFEHARADFELALQIASTACERQLAWRVQLDLAGLWTARDYEQSRRCIDLALELACALDEPELLAGSLNWVGNWHTNAEAPGTALEYHREALKIFELSGQRKEQAATLDLLGITSLLGCDYAAGVDYYNRAIEIFRELDDRAGLAACLTGRGLAGSGAYSALTVASPVGSLDARGDLEAALQIARAIASPPDEAWALLALSILDAGQGHFGQALEAAQRALSAATEVGHREWIAGSHSILGALYVELLAPETAQPYLEQALELAQRLRSQHWIHHATGALAATWRLLGQPARAHACLATALAAPTGMATLHGRTCWAGRAGLALAEGDPCLALDIADRLIATAPGLTPGRVVTHLWQLKGEALTALGQFEAAFALLQAAVENARSPGERFHLWRVHASLGRLYSAMDRQTEAQHEFAAARDLILALAQSAPNQGLRENFVQRACSMLTSPP